MMSAKHQFKGRACESTYNGDLECLGKLLDVSINGWCAGVARLVVGRPDHVMECRCRRDAKISDLDRASERFETRTERFDEVLPRRSRITSKDNSAGCIEVDTEVIGQGGECRYERFGRRAVGQGSRVGFPRLFEHLTGRVDDLDTIVLSVQLHSTSRRQDLGRSVPLLDCGKQ